MISKFPFVDHKKPWRHHFCSIFECNKFLVLSWLLEVKWQKVFKAKLTKPGDFRGRGHFDLNLGHLKVTWSRVMAKFIQQNNTSASYTLRQLELWVLLGPLVSRGPLLNGWNARNSDSQANDIYVRVRQAAQSFGGRRFAPDQVALI